MEEEYQYFVKIGEKANSDEFMELPQERDGTVLLSTIQAQFPTAVGLKYKSSSGGWRGIRAENNVLHPPNGDWGEQIYVVTSSDILKRQSCGDEHSKLTKTAKLLEDLIVLGLPYATTEEELKQYFTESCGELSFCQLKKDRNTDQSRGFGFIRFQNEEDAQAAIKGQHEIQGRKLVVRLSQRKGDTPTKLFVGRLPLDITSDEVNTYFSEFGDLVDCFCPNPFRGFAFVTYSDPDDAKKVLRMSHSLQGIRLNVSAADPKSAREVLKQEKIVNSSNPYGKPPFHQSYGGNAPYSRNNGQNQQFNQMSGYNPRSAQGSYAPPQKDVVSELKDMLLTFINNQK